WKVYARLRGRGQLNLGLSTAGGKLVYSGIPFGFLWIFAGACVMRRFFRQLISAALLPVCVCSLASGGDWPQFLGSNRNGISAETGLAATLDADSIKTVWKTPLGVGMSGIAVSGSLACTLYQTETEQFAVALDAATGQPIWKTALAPAYETPWATALGQHPPSPATA
ncbi:MAG: Quinoprotein ethanol dehydrogenase precursor, partial [Planctomycetota bacterium]